MGIFLRLLFLTAFGWVGYVLYHETEIQAHLVNPDDSRVALLFAGMILDGLVVGLIVTLMVVPALGERIGAYLFNPRVEIEKDAHADAIAKLAQGDPEGAIADYEQIFEKDPMDTLALSEIARICCRDLGDTARAAVLMERALEGEWPHEQGSFLANRLADIYLLQDDPVRARQLIVEVASTMEGTRYGANALHRLHEIDRSIETGERAAVYMEESGERAVEEEPVREEAGEAEPPVAEGV